MADSTLENLDDISTASPNSIQDTDLFYLFRPGSPDADYKAPGAAVLTYIGAIDGLSIEDDGSEVVATAVAINFTGGAVSVSDAGSGVATVSISTAATGAGAGGDTTVLLEPPDSTTAEAHQAYDVAIGHSAIAGDSGNASNQQNVAIGYAAEATGRKSVALGTDSISSGTNTVAIGDSAEATGTKSVAISNLATATAENAVAIGNVANADAIGAFAIGDHADGGHVDSIAIGAYAVTTHDDQIAVANTHAFSLGNMTTGNIPSSMKDGSLIYDTTVDKVGLRAGGSWTYLVSEENALLSDTTGVTGADSISNVISLSQAEYDAITPDSATLYVIV